MSLIKDLILNPQTYQRRKTRVVWVGDVGVGGQFPLRIQSMVTADTTHTQGVVDEIEALVLTGCEIVRLTVPTQEACDNLPAIRSELKKRGIKVPLVADIHFTPSIAMKVVEHVEKVRINPGNFVDKKLFKVKDYTDAEYESELIKIREKFEPLVLKCKQYGVTMRIGTNHGSLSDRIMNRYGDSPEGMVESALEFVRLCEDQGYRDIILSMKASNVQVMIAAYRLLAYRLAQVGRDYPFHLGVTEAGEGEDGRIKSAIGIGSLLEDGIGDTLRVSLTEDPVYEIPVAYQLASRYQSLALQSMTAPSEVEEDEEDSDLTQPQLEYTRRPSSLLVLGDLKLGEKEPVRVWMPVGPQNAQDFMSEFEDFVKTPQSLDQPLEGLELQVESSGFDIEAFVSQVQGLKTRPVLALATSEAILAQHYHSLFSKITARVLLGQDCEEWIPLVSQAACFEWNLWVDHPVMEDMADYVLHLLEISQHQKNLLFSVTTNEPIEAYRILAAILASRGQTPCLHLRFKPRDGENVLLSTSVALGGLLVDGLGDSIQVEVPLPVEDQVSLCYGILQGCRIRISKTEYISCPSCGRTQFDLQTTTDKIREKTGHLKGVKIAVMGCIVNGPGEMADADFGYVGTGVKKISLYVGKECVERNIPEEEAVERLIALIKQHGRWTDPRLSF